MSSRDSNDDKAGRAGIETRTGKKWSASQAVEQEEIRLQRSDIVGIICIGRQGQGTSNIKRWKKRNMVQDEIRKRTK